jgi:signal transduction histidine kinase
MTVADLPSQVAMDQRVIEIALQNLLSNALKYSAPDSQVSLELRGSAFGRILFTVRDCGIGIPEEDMSHIFTSFYRASNVGDVPGTGLGLAIVKACADVHGGTVEMESSPGAGTCIRMCFPDWLRLPNALEEVPPPAAKVTKG